MREVFSGGLFSGSFWANPTWVIRRRVVCLGSGIFDCTPCFAMAIVNLRQASAHLGFRTTTTLRRLLQAGELSAYVRSGPDLRATYLDVAPKGRPTLRQHVQAHTECRGNSPLWGADYESWPKPSGNWTDVANSYLDLPQWGPPPWTELQWVTLRNVIELAENSC